MADLPPAGIFYNSRGETRQLRIRGTAVLRAAAAGVHVELQIERPRQFCVPLLLLTTLAHAFLFPALQLARRALIFASPRAASRRGSRGGMRRLRPRPHIGAVAWWMRGARW